MENPMKVAVVQPQGVMMGAVEIFGFGEYNSRDYSEYAVPPNLGLMVLRFPIEGLEQYAERILKEGVNLKVEPKDLVIQPYGQVKIMALRTPNGSWIEFYEENTKEG
jgi:hypothetical protein